MSRFLIDVTESDKKWIRMAAKQLGWKTAEVVQLSISKLREEKWDNIKAELERKRMAEDLAQIQKQIESMELKKRELSERLTTV